MIEDEVPILQPDMSARGQDEDTSEIRNEQENTVSILKPPEETYASVKVE